MEQQAMAVVEFEQGTLSIDAAVNRTWAQCRALPRSGSDARRKDHGSLRARIR